MPVTKLMCKPHQTKIDSELEWLHPFCIQWQDESLKEPKSVMGKDQTGNSPDDQQKKTMNWKQ